MTPAEIANKEKIYESAWKSITDKFNMLNSWNVGADTGQSEFVKQVCMEAMEKWGALVAIQARIQERKDHICLLEQSLAGLNWAKTYQRCMKDEMLTHKERIEHLEKELENLK